MYDCSNCAAATVAGMIPRCFGWDPLSTVSTTCHSWTVKFVVELSEKGENKRKKNKWICSSMSRNLSLYLSPWHPSHWHWQHHHNVSLTFSTLSFSLPFPVKSFITFSETDTLSLQRHHSPLVSFPPAIHVCSSHSSLLTAVPQHQWWNSLQLYVLPSRYQILHLLSSSSSCSLLILTAVMEHGWHTVLFFCDSCAYFGFATCDWIPKQDQPSRVMIHKTSTFSSSLPSLFHPPALPPQRDQLLFPYI